MDFTEGVLDELPDSMNLEDSLNNKPKVPDELIKGIVRVGHKMLISGSSKAGKSFLLMELAVSLSEGIEWLDFKYCGTPGEYFTVDGFTDLLL